jgi:hypothetical protein
MGVLYPSSQEIILAKECTYSLWYTSIVRGADIWQYLKLGVL